MIYKQGDSVRVTIAGIPGCQDVTSRILEVIGDKYRVRTNTGVTVTVCDTCIKPIG